MAYDPLGRLQSLTQGSAITRFGYDGSDLVTERNGSNTLTRRYVHGPGTDAPIVWYEGATTSDRRFLHADERGSIVAVTNGTGGVVGINRYDDYGVPATSNIGRFQYTGQTWMPELGLYNYKARFYDPKLGRFMQTDPISYNAGMNLYAYVGGDPVNMIDPTGMIDIDDDIVVNGRRSPSCDGICITDPDQISIFMDGFGSGVPRFFEPVDDAIVVTATKPKKKLPAQTQVTRVILDRSCLNSPIANDPSVQRRALKALKQSLSGQRPREWGFVVAQPFIGSSNWVGPLFYDDQLAGIGIDRIRRASPMALENLLTGYYPTVTLVHTHPNNTPPSGVSDDDNNLGMPVIAIDKGGNMFCGGVQ